MTYLISILTRSKWSI